MSKKAKEAYLRRHGLGERRSGDADAELAPEPVVVKPRSTSEDERVKSFAQKRKENIKARANGGRVTKEEAVQANVHLFAAKLKARASGTDLVGLEGAASARGYAEPSSEDVARPSSAPPTAREKKPKEPHEQTWTERRKERYLATHRGKPKQVEVAVTALLFAAKLKARSSKNVLSSRSEGAASADAPPPPAEAPPPPKTPKTPGEKSFAQKRKEAILARNGVKKEPPPAHVAVTAVVFASKLKRLSSKDKDLSSMHSPVATGA